MNMDRKLFQKNHIISELEKKYPDRVFFVSNFYANEVEARENCTLG